MAYAKRLALEKYTTQVWIYSVDKPISKTPVRIIICSEPGPYTNSRCVARSSEVEPKDPPDLLVDDSPGCG